MLAESWTTASDGRSLLVKLRPGVKFHDGSPLDSETVAAALARRNAIVHGTALRRHRPHQGQPATTRSRSVFAPITVPPRVARSPDQETGIGCRHRAVHGPAGLDDRTAREHRVLPRPAAHRRRPTSRRSQRPDGLGRAAREPHRHALRGRTDALDSLESSTNVSVFTFTRRYQYVVVLNAQAPVFKVAEIRRALNLAVDREEVVRDALNGTASPSSGPIWPRYWALPRRTADSFGFDPERAAAMLGTKGSETACQHRQGIRFTCLVPPDSLYERIALEVKRQLAAVGVEHDVRGSVARTNCSKPKNTRQYEAILTEGDQRPDAAAAVPASGIRRAPRTAARFGNATIDAALDRVRHAESDDEYRRASPRSSRPSSTTRRRSSWRGASAPARSASGSSCPQPSRPRHPEHPPPLAAG